MKTRSLRHPLHPAAMALAGLLVVPAQVPSQTIQLSTLNGTTGFRIDGVEAADACGQVVSGAGDFNGDGFDDLLVSARNADGPSNSTANGGEFYLLFGSASASPVFALSALSSTTGRSFYSPIVGNQFGTALTGLGDFNADGFGDIIAGGATADDAAYLIYGGTGLVSPVNVDAISTSGRVELLDGFQDVAIATASSIGDWNGDGLGDFTVTSRYSNYTPNMYGKTSVVYGFAPGAFSSMFVGDVPDPLGFTLDGASSPDQGPWFSTGIGDFNGDGLDDFLYSENRYQNFSLGTRGSFFIVPGSMGPLSPYATMRFLGEPGSFMTYYIEGVGDFNGDGLADIAGGAAYNQSLAVGDGCVIFGTRQAQEDPVELSDLNGSNGLRLVGTPVGCSFSGGGDYNSDGFLDVLCANTQDKAYMVFGGAGPHPSILFTSSITGSTGRIFQGPTPSERTGNRVTHVGDFNGDGRSDFALGTELNRAYMVFGPTPPSTSTYKNYARIHDATSRAFGSTGDGRDGTPAGRCWIDFDSGWALGPNLVTNGGCESALVGGEIPGWTETTGTQWTTRGGTDPAAFEGVNYFFAGAVATGVLAQPVDLAAYADWINSETVEFEFSARLRSFNQAPADVARAKIEFYDSSSLRHTYDSGNIANTSAWQLISDLWQPDPYTDFAVISLTATRMSGTNNDGYFDDVRLVPHQASLQTSVLTRSSASITNLAPPKANVLWNLTTDRVSFGNARVTFKYTNAEIAGRTEANLKLYQATAASGPWTQVTNGFTLDTARNRISGLVSTLGYFAIAELDTTAPTVTGINRVNVSPALPGTVGFYVNFSEPVTGVDTGDFQVVETLPGSPTNGAFFGSGSSYQIYYNTGAGPGTLQLNLVDNDSIRDLANLSLGGSGAGNGNFTGQSYTVDNGNPTVSITRGQTNATEADVVYWNVNFSEPVTPTFTGSDLSATGTLAAGAQLVLGGDDPNYVAVAILDNAGADGTIGFNISGTVRDNNSFILVGPTTAPAYTIDNSLTTTMNGDVNKDGVVDLADVALLADFNLGLATLP